MTRPADMLFGTVQHQSFDGARLARWRAPRSTFEDVTFRGADLTSAVIEGSTFTRCDFSGARMCDVDAHECVFRSCRFDRANLAGLTLKDAVIEATSFEGACFAGARLDRARFEAEAPRVDVDAPDEPAVGSVVGGVRLDEEIAGAMFSAIFRGEAVIGPPTDTLVTFGSRIDKLPVVRAELMYAVDGVAPMVAITEAHSPSRVRTVLFEQRPEGRPVVELAPLPAAQARSLLVEVARVVEAAHDRHGAVLYGVHPRLCFAHRTAEGVRFSGLAPRTMRFLLALPPARGGLCLDEVYLPFEIWRTPVVRDAPNEPADVFATCALGLFLLTGEHPFTGPTFDAAIAAVASGRRPFVEGALGHVIARGLAAEPAERPTARELRAALEAL